MAKLLREVRSEGGGGIMSNQKTVTALNGRTLYIEHKDDGVIEYYPMTYFEERTCHMTRDVDYPCAEGSRKRLIIPKWICSECEWDSLGVKPNYCPNCGARVEE